MTFQNGNRCSNLAGWKKRKTSKWWQFASCWSGVSLRNGSWLFWLYGLEQSGAVCLHCPCLTGLSGEVTAASSTEEPGLHGWLWLHGLGDLILPGKHTEQFTTPRTLPWPLAGVLFIDPFCWPFCPNSCCPLLGHGAAWPEHGVKAGHPSGLELCKQLAIMHWFIHGCPAQRQVRLCIPGLELTFLPLYTPALSPVFPVTLLLLCCHHVPYHAPLCALLLQTCLPTSLQPVTASPASCLALSVITAPLQAQSRYVQLARLSRRAPKPAWDISAPDCLSACETCCHSAASTPSPDQMFYRPAFICSELGYKLYFCVYFSSASSFGSVIFIHQFLV